MSQSKLLKEVLEEYIQKNPRLSYNTIQAHRYSWRNLIMAIGNIDLKLIDYNEIEDYQADLFGRGLLPGAVRSNLKMCSPVFSWAVRRGYIATNPFEGFKLPKVPQKEIRFYSDAELSAMLAAADNIMLQARIIASASAGLRKGEGLNLTIRDIDFEQGHIKVQSKKETKDTWRWTTKSHQCRRAPLSEQLSKLFTMIIEDLPVGQPYLLLSERTYFWNIQLRDKGKLSDRKRCTPDENHRPWTKIKQITGIVGTFHDLRRTCITRWTWKLPPKEVQRLAGHADIKTTLEYYSAIRADVLQRAVHTIGATGLEPATS